MSHVRIYGRNRLLSVPVVLPDLQEEVEQALCLLRTSTQTRPGALNKVIVVAKLSFHHVQSKQSSAV